MTPATTASSPPALSTEPSTRLSFRAAILITLYGVLVLGIGLGNHVLTRHEVLAAYPAKEMLRYGHWIVQMFAGIPRTLKPPTTGWMIAACMKVFRSDAEWVARLPAMIAGIATALMIAAFAARRFGRKVGVLTGLVQLTCYYVQMQATLAEADMLLCAAVTAAMLAFVIGVGVGHGSQSGTRREGEACLAPTAFYAATGFAFLLKGPNGLIFILSAVIAYAIVRRERHVVRFLLNPIGIVTLLALLIGWPLAAYLQHPAILHDWYVEMHTTATGGFGRDSLFTYLGSVPGVLVPWTPVMAIGIYVFIKQGYARQPLGQFFACWFIPGIIYLHFIALKHKHYPIPLLPPFSILGAIGLLWYIDYQHRNPRPRHLLSAILLAIGCAVGGVAVFFVPITKPLATSLLIPIAMLCIGGIAAIWYEHRRNTNGQLIAIFATAAAVIVPVHTLIIPAFDTYRPLAQLAQRANTTAPADQVIYIIDEKPEIEPHAAYYLRPPIRRHPNVDAFDSFARGKLTSPDKRLYVFCVALAADALRSNWDVQVLDRCDQLRRTEKEPDRFLFVQISTRQR